MAGLREFNTATRRASRDKLKITIDEHEFRRRRMTGGRFREILEQDEDQGPAPKTNDEIAEMLPDERSSYLRERSLANADSIYRQVAQLIEPVSPEALGLEADAADEDAIFEWLGEHLDWDDAPALLEWLDAMTSTKGSKGNAVA